MFNRDLTQIFRQAEIRPTDDFRSTLRKRVLAERVSQAPRRAFNWLRVLTVGTASVALGAIALNATFGPNHSNAVLAEAIQNTFGLEDGKYHHQTMKVWMRYDDMVISDTTEYWQDDMYTILDRTQHEGWDPGFTSQYLSSVDDLSCTTVADTEPICATPQFPHADPIVNGDTLDILDMSAEAANDTHGDMYVTWVTNHQLVDATLQISGPDNHGFLNTGWSGSYSFVDDHGRYINRVTLHKSDILQSHITPSSVFYVKVLETGPRVIKEIDGEMYNMPSEEVLAESAVYRIETSDWTVTMVDDTELDELREITRRAYVDYMTSAGPVRMQYEMGFMHLLSMQEAIDQHTLKNTETIKVNGRDVQLLSYALTSERSANIQGINATRAEFAIDQETNTILWFNLFDASGNMLQHVELLIQEERDKTPEGIFDLEAWKARVVTL